MVRRQKVLAAILNPLHRPSGQPRRERDQEVLGIEFAANAEPAADVVLHHGDRILGAAHLLRQEPANGIWHLARARNRQSATARIHLGEQTARLHRHRRMALHLEALAPNVVGLPERSVRITADTRQGAREIRTALFEQKDLALLRRVTVRHWRQRLNVEGDRLQRILGNSRVFGQHHGNRLADVAHLLIGDDRLLELPEGGQLVQPQWNGRHGAAEIRRRYHRMDSSQRERSTGVDRPDAAVSERAAQDHRIEQAVARQIIDEFASAAEKTKVLAALDRAADEGIGCGHAPCSSF